MAASSSLPLFPAAPGADGVDEPETRAPAGVERQASVAAPRVRVMAGLLDVAYLAAVDAAVVVLTLRLAGLDVASIGALPVVPMVAFLTLLDGGYVVSLTLVGGQTFGKMTCGVRVVDRAGHGVTVSAAVLRAAGYLVSILPFGLGTISMWFDPERRTWHDRLAGTRVLTVPPPRVRHS